MANLPANWLHTCFALRSSFRDHWVVYREIIERYYYPLLRQGRTRPLVVLTGSNCLKQMFVQCSVQVWWCGFEDNFGLLGWFGFSACRMCEWSSRTANTSSSSLSACCSPLLDEGLLHTAPFFMISCDDVPVVSMGFLISSANLFFFTRLSFPWGMPHH